MQYRQQCGRRLPLQDAIRRPGHRRREHVCGHGQITELRVGCGAKHRCQRFAGSGSCLLHQIGAAQFGGGHMERARLVGTFRLGLHKSANHRIEHRRQRLLTEARGGRLQRSHDAVHMTRENGMQQRLSVGVLLVERAGRHARTFGG